ncbi:MAG: competence protein CoiA [Limisphaerales bacterium]
MLCARRKSDNRSVIAKWESRANAPFACPECGGEVVLRQGTARMNHFAHKSPISCHYAGGETSDHRRCKLEIYEALLRRPGVTDVRLERSLGSARPDVSANFNGVPVAIEVQISTLSQETILRRTKEYERKGIYVLWLLQWTPYLDGSRYSPRLWEKWVHAAYFGRVYYWVKGLTVAAYSFDPYFSQVPPASWYSDEGEQMSARGYNRKSKRYRTPVRRRTLNLASDFVPRQREWWKGGNLTIPFAKLFIDRHCDQK